MARMNMGVAAGVVALGGYFLGENGQLGPLQGFYDTKIKPALMSKAGATGGRGAGGAVPTAAQVAAWAQNINLGSNGVCIGTAFVAQYGRLPGSVSELQTWGTQSGHLVNGNWVCS